MSIAIITDFDGLIGAESVNFFYGQSLTKRLKECVKLKTGATVILHPVKTPSLYGIASINKKNKIIKYFLRAFLKNFI